MTAARSTLIDLNSTPFYHCMARCVRQSYLCGIDIDTGRDYSHRKQWILNRLKKLATIFAIRICAYAIMSNHYHLVLFIDEEQAKNWQHNAIKARWQKIFPNDVHKFETLNASEFMLQQKIKLWRERLSSISWFMRCLNEPIAKHSNQEDDCRGRFWAGRFKSQALLDEGAILSAMAYVDLNPIRANIAITPEESDFTSIQERIKTLNNQIKPIRKEINCSNLKQPKFLMPFANTQDKIKANFNINFSLLDYLKLVDSTGKIIRNDKKGHIPKTLSPILSRLHLSVEGWMIMATQLEEKFYNALGNETLLLKFSEKNNIAAPKGIQSAKKCYLGTAA